MMLLQTRTKAYHCSVVRHEIEFTSYRLLCRPTALAELQPRSESGLSLTPSDTLACAVRHTHSAANGERCVYQVR